MARKQHAPSNEPAEVDEIAALEASIIQASEERWRFYGISEAEIMRLRPGVAQLAHRVCDQLREEYAARIHP